MIKKIINHFRSKQSFSSADEVDLFRSLANSITSHSKSIFIDETHGKICNVEFTSVIGKLTTCEIADLLIISISQTGTLRATFWQVKKQQKSKWILATSSPSQFDFKGQFNQWDLLSRRPDNITGIGSFKPQPTLLSSFNSAAIGSFGVFYEKNSLIEVNHSIAEFISCNNPTAVHPTMIINNYLTKYFYDLNEIIVRPTLEGFLTSLFSHQIGAVLDKTKAEHKWLVSYAKSKVGHAFGNNIKIDEFDSFLQENHLPVEFEMADSSDGLSILIIREQNDIASPL